MSQTLLGGGSQLNKFKEIEAHLSRNLRTVHVELDGDDIKGNGSISKPFKTVERALKESVGTALTLEMILGEGVHSCKYISAYFTRIEIRGSGSLAIATENGVFTTCQQGGILLIDVDIVDASTAAYDAAFSFSGGGLLLLRPSVNVSLKNANALVFNGHGQNAIYFSAANIVSSKAIPKINAGINSEVVSVTENGVTYTNIA